MKWKEFKRIIESKGVTDETEINYIDTDMYEPKVERIYQDNSVNIE